MVAGLQAIETKLSEVVSPIPRQQTGSPWESGEIELLGYIHETKRRFAPSHSTCESLEATRFKRGSWIRLAFARPLRAYHLTLASTSGSAARLTYSFCPIFHNVLDRCVKVFDFAVWRPDNNCQIGSA